MRSLKENELSIFIDESGDFGDYDDACRFYVVSMVLHEQNKDISGLINKLENHVSNLGFPKHNIHVGPLIRRETKEYENFGREERRNLFNSLFHFFRQCPLNYLSVTIKKEKGDDQISLASKITKSLKIELARNSEYLSSFGKIIIYYDNGQIQLTKILTTLFNAMFENVEMRKVQPKDYKLFQAADLTCSIELIEKKRETAGLSRSEHDFFEGNEQFKKNIYKTIKKKKL